MSASWRRWIGWLIALGLLGGIGWFAWDYAERYPEKLPWTALDLKAPVGPFTGRKLAALRDDPGQCRTLLRDAGIVHTPLPPRTGDPNCAFSDAVRLDAGGARSVALRPAGAGMSCAVAAALALWEERVVQPAAQRHFGRPIEALEHLGTYSCRRIGGRDDADFSEHATANAIDIAAFRLRGGQRISLVGDWTGTGPEAAFLRDVRDGACDLFATVLSPDYNAAHRDHLHFDQASRGATGWRGCR